jgi:hypothetical protein
LGNGAVRRGERRSLAADGFTRGGTERDRQVGEKIAERTGFGIADEQLGRGEPAHRLARVDRLHREAGRRQQLAHLLLVDAMGQAAERPRIGIEGRPRQHLGHELLEARARALGAAADAQSPTGLQHTRELAERPGLFRQPVEHGVEAYDVEIYGQDR